jgi:hypothetical protein
MRFGVKKSQGEALMSWTEPEFATSLRGRGKPEKRSILVDDEDRRLLHVDQEGRIRLNWQRLVTAAAILIFIGIELRPWEWREGGIWGIYLIVAAAMTLLGFVRNPTDILRHYSGMFAVSVSAAVVSIEEKGIRVGSSLIPWSRIRRYRLGAHPTNPHLRTLDLSVDSALLGRSEFSLAFDPMLVDERKLSRLLFDLHPLAYWENVGAV